MLKGELIGSAGANEPVERESCVTLGSLANYVLKLATLHPINFTFLRSHGGPLLRVPYIVYVSCVFVNVGHKH